MGFTEKASCRPYKNCYAHLKGKQHTTRKVTKPKVTKPKVTKPQVTKPKVTKPKVYA